ATTRTPGNDQFDRPLGISGRDRPATEQCDTAGQQQNREASHGRTHGLLPANRPLACMPCPRPSRQKCSPAYVCRLIAHGRGFHPDEVSFCETSVLNTLTEGLGPARVNPRHYVSPSDNLVPAAGVVEGFSGWPAVAYRRSRDT